MSSSHLSTLVQLMYPESRPPGFNRDPQVPTTYHDSHIKHRCHVVGSTFSFLPLEKDGKRLWMADAISRTKQPPTLLEIEGGIARAV